MACKMGGDMGSEEYKEWYEGHTEECECNYKGSFKGMEIASVKALCIRSVKDLMF